MLNPKIYSVLLHSSDSTSSNGFYRWILPNMFGDVDNNKNYYCIISNVQMQGIANPGAEYRSLLIQTNSFNITNSYYSRNNGRSNVLKVCQILHDVNAHFVSLSERLDISTADACVISGSSLFNCNSINLQFLNLNDEIISFEAEAYTRFLITINFIEVQ